MTRFLFKMATAGAVLFACVAPASAQGTPAVPVKGGVIDVSTIGEPPTLDSMVSTADIVGMISQHIFETLYTFDEKWSPKPLLADGMPTFADGGKSVTIKLRPGVKFHDGSDFDADDAVASLNRWLTLSPRGKSVAATVTKVEKVDALSVKLTLTGPLAPLLPLLSFNNSAAIMLPSDKTGPQMTETIGTGPYRLIERKPDQFIRLGRFEGYKSPPGAADGYAGARGNHLDEIRFVPVPDANSRVEAMLAGQHQYSESMPVESIDRLKGKAGIAPIILKPFGFPIFAMNMRKGIMTNLDLRRAVQTALGPEDMLAAAFGEKEFYTANGALYPKPFVWNSDMGVKAYGQANAKAAGELLKSGKYDGSPLRILTSRQYEFHFKMAQVAAEYLKACGFKVQLDVVDWATLTQRRGNPDLWDIFITHSPFLPEPSLNSVYADSSPIGWTSPKKNEVLAAFNTELDPAKRVAIFAELQGLIFADVPFYKVGDFNALRARSVKLKGMNELPWPAFWNASLDK